MVDAVPKVVPLEVKYSRNTSKKFNNTDSLSFREWFLVLTFLGLCLSMIIYAFAVS